MLQLDRGRAMDYLTQELERERYSLGVPRRRRSRLRAAAAPAACRAAGVSKRGPSRSCSSEPRGTRIGRRRRPSLRASTGPRASVVSAGPSTPSPPERRLDHRYPLAARDPHARRGVVLPEIRDAERLQGFDADWTRPAEATTRRREPLEAGRERGQRPVARWVGERLKDPTRVRGDDEPARTRAALATRRMGRERDRRIAPFTAWPALEPYQHLAEFLRYPTTPLSLRATEGFYSRVLRSSLRFPEGFKDVVRAHRDRMRETAAA